MQRQDRASVSETRRFDYFDFEIMFALHQREKWCTATNAGTSFNPKGNVWAVDSDVSSGDKYYAPYDSTKAAVLASEAVTVKTTVDIENVTMSGGNASPTAFSIHSPYLALNFIIATQGIFPSR